MREKFFQEGNYRLTLDDIRAREAKPKNRIELDCSMLLERDDLKHAPTRIRRVWEIVSNPELDTIKIEITSSVKAIDVEMFATPPDGKTPLVICLSNCTIGDLEVHRQRSGEIRLNFSIELDFSSAVWTWAGKQAFMDCFARFSESQTELFDEPAEKPAKVIRKPVEPSLESAETCARETCARELGTAPPEPAGAPGIDPLRSELTGGGNRRARAPVIKGGPVRLPGATVGF
jgi:hypothetical protein